MKRIRHIRQFLQKRKSRWIDLVTGILLGTLLPPLFAASVAIFSKLPSVIRGTLFLLLFLTQASTLAWLILLHEKYDQCKRYLSEHCPGVDLDAEDELSDAWNEATKKAS